MRRPQVAGDWQRLFRVPKNVLIDRVLQGPDEQLQPTLERLLEHPCTPDAAGLAGLSSADVVLTCQECIWVSAQDAHDLYQQYRYRGMKTFYLYECAADGGDVAVDVDALNTELERLEADHRRQTPSYRYSHLQFQQPEPIAVDDRAAVEIPYTYVAAVPIVRPDTEYPDLVDDLRRGFVWLRTSARWIAICARDEAINALLETALHNILGMDSRRVLIPKSVVEALQPLEEVRRITHRDPQTGTTRRTTNPSMSRDPEAMNEVRARDLSDERPTSGYNEALPDGTHFAVGYSNDRGLVFLSKDLTVDQMRPWGLQKVDAIIEGLRGLRSTQPEELVAPAVDAVLARYGTALRNAVRSVASAIATCRRDGVTNRDLAESAIQLAELAGSHCSTLWLVDCETCEAPVPACCGACGSMKLVLHDGQLQCGDCEQPLDLEAVHCTDGHIARMADVGAMCQLVPGSTFMQAVSQVLQSATGSRLNPDEEFFHVRGNRLVYRLPGRKVVFRSIDIPEFVALLGDSASADDLDTIRDLLGGFKEKCRRMSIERCATCVTTRVGEKCYLRLFGLFDPEHTPRPHEGHEYGDYSREVTVDGRLTQLVVAMKPGSPAQHVTPRSAKGQDILSQAIGYLRDGDKGMVGVSTPSPLHDDLRGQLRYWAERGNKTLLFLDADDLSRIVHSVLQRQQLTLDDL